ncbi:MAG: DJ-1/PfpI family protein [Sulfurospirillaceae bacterium]|nr:DJ-1/PfpI family protein [Sulfurospirillaceae bacterium]
MPKVLIPLAVGFEEIEAVTIADILKRAGVEVELVALENLDVVGAHGIVIKAQTHIKDIKADDFDMVVLPGGLPGATNLAESEDVKALLNTFAQSKKYIGAICAAPLALKEAGVLRNAYTCYPSFEKKIQADGYTSDKDIVCDENIITSKGPATAMSFALFLVEKLIGVDASNRLKKELLFSN